MWKKFHQARENLAVRFQTKKLGALKHFLGLEVKRTKIGMVNCKPVSTVFLKSGLV
jgi:hypothetical protein